MRTDPVSENVCSLNTLKAELLGKIGSVSFYKHLHSKASQIYGQELIAYRLKNVRNTTDTYRRIHRCGFFRHEPKNNDNWVHEGLIFENGDSIRTNPADTYYLNEAESVFIKAVRYHHLMMDYKERALARSLLTQREGEILHLIQKCLSNNEIAEDLKISVRTVEKHCQNIFEKLQVENRNALIHLIGTHEMLAGNMTVRKTVNPKSLHVQDCDPKVLDAIKAMLFDSIGTEQILHQFIQEVGDLLGSVFSNFTIHSQIGKIERIVNIPEPTAAQYATIPKINEYIDEQPVMAHFRANKDKLSIRKISDFLSTESFRATDLYRYGFGPMGFDHMLSAGAWDSQGRLYLLNFTHP